MTICPRLDDGGTGGQAGILPRGLRAPAGKSSLNRLELNRATPSRYHKISHDAPAIENLFVDLFLDAHARAPAQITLDLDATDDPLHGHQEGRFFGSDSNSVQRVCIFRITC
jgi:hypothetical protein